MKRANVFALAPTREQEKTLFDVALGCAKLRNEVNYRRRQAYLNRKAIEWYPKDLYQKYTLLVGSATAQQVIRKNNEAWKSFLALKRLEGLGKLPKHIRDGNSDNGAKANSMIHNFWSFNYIVQRLRDMAEEYCMEVDEVSEYKTSTRCIKCGSENVVDMRRLFKCLNCGLEAHRDAIGVLNIGFRRGGSVNGVMAYPLLLRWDGMRWKPKRTMNNQSMNTVRSKNPTNFSCGGVN